MRQATGIHDGRLRNSVSKSLRLLREGDLSAAISSASKDLEAQPSDPQANWLMGEIALAVRLDDEANRLFSAAWNGGWRSGRLYASMAHLEILGNGARTEEFLDKTRESPITDWDSALFLAYHYAYKKETSAAMTCCDVAERLAPVPGRVEAARLMCALRGMREEDMRSVATELVNAPTLEFWEDASPHYSMWEILKSIARWSLDRSMLECLSRRFLTAKIPHFGKELPTFHLSRMLYAKDLAAVLRLATDDSTAGTDVLEFAASSVLALVGRGARNMGQVDALLLTAMASRCLGDGMAALAAADAAGKAVETDCGMYSNWSIIKMQQNDFWDEAMAFFRSKGLLSPKYARHAIEFSNWRGYDGVADEVAMHWNEKGMLTSDMLVRQMLAVPSYWNSMDELRTYRRELARRCAYLAGSGQSIESPLAQGYGTTGTQKHFFLAFHPEDNAELFQGINSAYAALAPQLRWTSPTVAGRNAAARGELIDIGFVTSSCFNAVVFSYLASLKGLPRDKFRVTLLRCDTGADNKEDRRKLEDAADRVVTLPFNLARARERIASEGMDILYFPLVRAYAFMTFLGFSRMAPLQVTDYSDHDQYHFEIDYRMGLVDLCTQKLADGYGAFGTKMALFPFSPNNFADNFADNIERRDVANARRAELFLPQNKNLYLYSQRMEKWLPDFDEVVVKILERDPNGVLVMIKNLYAALSHNIIGRLERRSPGVSARIIAMPKLSHDDFVSLCGMADVILDSRPFGGGRSHMSAFNVGTPVVTWPDSDAPQSFLTSLQYRRIGTDFLIAKSSDEMADKAVEIARNPDLRNRLGEEIRKQWRTALHDDTSFAKVGNFLAAALQRKRDGLPNSHWIGDRFVDSLEGLLPGRVL